MANLPSKHPSLTLHLVDRTFTPLITSSRTQQQAQSLVSISQTAIVANETAQRLGLGSPQRVMVEHASNGPVLFHSFLNPAAEKTVPGQHNSGDASRLLTPIGGLGTPGVNAGSFAQDLREPDGSDEGDSNASPLLLSTVIAPNSEFVLEARRAAARLERIGKEVQTRWAEIQQQDGSSGA